MPSPILVDDSNPAVQYKPGWIWDNLVSEVDQTRHGAALDGLTAELGFSGTRVQVVGTLEPTDIRKNHFLDRHHSHSRVSRDTNYVSRVLGSTREP
ncbi:hypothetical protein C8Q80DRAFT_1210815 [Daedaleopsis nitida]|nr:hypothetical protein C8Q80DRAFT_1210815 [Daedaleopsis nitida]